MIGQYLSNTNESVRVSILQNILELIRSCSVGKIFLVLDFVACLFVFYKYYPTMN